MAVDGPDERCPGDIIQVQVRTPATHAWTLKWERVRTGSACASARK